MPTGAFTFDAGLRDSLFGFGFAGSDVGGQGFLEQIALFRIQRFVLDAEADATQVGQFEGERLDFGFGVLEGGIAAGKNCVESNRFGGLLLQAIEQCLNGDLRRIQRAEIGCVNGVGSRVFLGQFRARIHA